MRKKIIALTWAFLFATVAMATTASAVAIKVKDGDTLWTISQQHEVSIEEIKQQNHLHSDMIFAGSTIQVGEETTKPETLYTIKVGDTLSDISMKTGISVKKLKSYNALSSDLIVAGTTLKLTDENQIIVPGDKPKVKKEKQAEKVKTKKVSNPVSKKESVKEQKQPEETSRTLTMVATAYTADCTGCSGITAIGIDVRNSTPNIIAVDPSVIPLGSKVWVEGYGTAIAGDTGGAIKGNKIDLLVSDYSKAINYGVRTVTVKILD